MTKEDVIQKLQEMESRYNSGFSSIDKQYLDTVYFELFGKIISTTGCNSCYRDAYIEIYHKLKTLKEMPKKSNYTLKPGALITFFGESAAYTNANITDEVAERYLAQNDDLINQFQSYPLDYKQRVAAYKEGVPYVAEDTEDTDTGAMMQRIEQLTEENAALKAENAAMLEQIQRLNEKLEMTTAEAAAEEEAEAAEEAVNSSKQEDADEAEAEEAPEAEAQPQAEAEDTQTKAKKAKKTDK